MVNGWKNEEVIKDDISTLVDVQAILLTAVVSAGIQKYSLKAYNMVRNCKIQKTHSETIFVGSCITRGHLCLPLEVCT